MPRSASSWRRGTGRTIRDLGLPRAGSRVRDRIADVGEALLHSVPVGAEGQNLSTRQVANFPQVYITRLLETLRRPADIPRNFELAALLVMDTLNHTKFARRNCDESDKRIFLILPIVKDSIFLSEFSAGVVVASEIL